MGRVCPRDFTLLSAHEWGAATYHFCAACHGVHLERSEVEKIIEILNETDETNNAATGDQVNIR